MMKAHHLNCACMCPLGGRLFPKIFPREVICHCLLIESASGLILIDTGFSKAQLEDPKSLGSLQNFLGVKSNPSNAAVDQIRRLGFSLEDVTHLIPTHLDCDHAGAVVDFPKATVHSSEIEMKAAQRPRGFLEKYRYNPFKMPAGQNWRAHRFEDGEDWFGFQGVRPIPKTSDEILLIPLYGHTAGHFGVAVNLGSRWLFHVGDAYYNHCELFPDQGPGFKMFQRLVHADYKMALENQRRLVNLQKSQGDRIEIFCAHDPDEMPHEGRENRYG